MGRLLFHPPSAFTCIPCPAGTGLVGDDDSGSRGYLVAPRTQAYYASDYAPLSSHGLAKRVLRAQAARAGRSMRLLAAHAPARSLDSCSWMLHLACIPLGRDRSPESPAPSPSQGLVKKTWINASKRNPSPSTPILVLPFLPPLRLPHHQVSLCTVLSPAASLSLPTKRASRSSSRLLTHTNLSSAQIRAPSPSNPTDLGSATRAPRSPPRHRITRVYRLTRILPINVDTTIVQHLFCRIDRIGGQRLPPGKETTNHPRPVTPRARCGLSEDRSFR